MGFSLHALGAFLLRDGFVVLTIEVVQVGLGVCACVTKNSAKASIYVLRLWQILAVNLLLRFWIQVTSMFGGDSKILLLYVLQGMIESFMVAVLLSLAVFVRHYRNGQALICAMSPADILLYLSVMTVVVTALYFAVIVFFA